ncbi:hypothetical protein MPNT_140040 [Candidatus Methylacidithermus pantelleriae]|uniref:Uncharacterized protein n=1 Tax=Candidatus Methylacidithermus pantelleriae TaxID=2744239 RepID=A0A8J2BIE8_9BACT|nr:hypothetical protein MPNT_140040 [Candidatus Methylacidithermus pantelleriae]
MRNGVGRTAFYALTHARREKQATHAKVPCLRSPIKVHSLLLIVLRSSSRPCTREKWPFPFLALYSARASEIFQANHLLQSSVQPNDHPYSWPVLLFGNTALGILKFPILDGSFLGLAWAFWLGFFTKNPLHGVTTSPKTMPQPEPQTPRGMRGAGRIL